MRNLILTILILLVPATAGATLWDYYNGDLPSLEVRGELYGEGYTGTAEQNIELEALLRGPILGAQPALTAFQGGTGTSSPSGILYGDETIRLKTVTIGDNLTFSGGTLDATGGGGDFAWVPDTTYNENTNSTSTPIWLKDSLYASSTAYFGDTDTTLFVDTANNRVGIGTTSPDFALHIEKNQNSVTRIRVENTNTGTSARTGMRFLTSDATGQFIAFPNNYSSAGFRGRMVFVSDSTADNGLHLRASGSSADQSIEFQAAASNIGMKLTGVTQNLGIATTSPYAKLSVAGRGAFDNTVLASYFIGTSTATSTFGGGLDIATGCFAIGGTCLNDHDTVTMSGTPDYITLSGQDIVRGTIDIGDDTNLVAGTNITLSGDTLNVDNPVVADLTGNASTATALASNGANCSAGSYPLGVDASGASESCTDATTEIDSAISTHAAIADAHQALVTLAGTPNYLTLAGQVITMTVLDISDDTNLAVSDTSTIDMVLTGDTLSANGLYTAGDGLTLTTADFDCDTASSSVFGCLTAADWTTFNGNAPFAWTPSVTYGENTNATSTPIWLQDTLYASSTAFIDGATVFNNDGSDDDFRVEGDTETHMIFVDAGNDSVGVGTSATGNDTLVVGGEVVLEKQDVEIITAGSQSFTPTHSYVEITCGAASPISLTISETNATEGQVLKLVWVQVVASGCSMPDSAGVQELAGTFTPGQYDSMELIYIGDRWVELSRSNN